MRQLTITVPSGKSEIVTKAAKEHNAKNIVHLQNQEHEVITLHLNNDILGSFLGALEEIPEAEISFFPSGVIALYPPANEVPERVTHVTNRSPIEVYMGGLQSMGTKKGMIGYAIAAGAVVWIGLYTNTMYLLTASMLIAPFGGPAMNAAIATSSGNGSLLRQSLMRYFLALAITIAITFILSLIFQLKFPTPFMASISQISQVTALLPLFAGMAGALNLIQSERASLVSGAAVGVLVAASMALPAGIAGMAMAIGRWDMVVSGLFLVLLQLAGINFSAALVFRFYGKLKTTGPRFFKGKEMVYGVSMIASVLLASGLIFWQLSNKPNLERSSIEALVAEEMKLALKEKLPEIKVINAKANFTRSQVEGMNPLMCEIAFIKSEKCFATADSVLKRQVLQVAKNGISQGKYNITPLFEVTLLDRGADIASNQ